MVGLLSEGEVGADRRAPGRIAAALLDERDRWPLWLPVFLGTGVALYFLLPAEPTAWAGPAAAAAGILALALAWRSPFWRPVVAVLVCLTAGFALAQARTALVGAPMLDREIGPALVDGLVESQDELPAGRRLVLRAVAIEDMELAATPDRVRVTVRTGSPLTTGSRVRVRAVLQPPSGPVAPGAFDFRRQAFFDGIGGIGYALGAPVVLDASGSSSVADGIERIRQAGVARIGAVLDGDEGAIVVALLTGERGLISDEANDAMRDSGLAHLLSISGLHFALVAGVLFFVIRLVLSLWEGVALRFPTKKWAACLALAGAFFYLLIAGLSPPTQRSFAMTGLALLAILVDRSPISMRLVAWAAVFVLAWRPEGLLGPSFQMSFGAVVAMIAAFEAPALRRLHQAAHGRVGRAALYVGGIALTTLIATAATAPFGLYHFQQFTLYGVAANLLAIPITSFWVMPLGVLSAALMPLGLEALALVPMGWGVAAILWVARTIAGWPGATVVVPAMPSWGLAAVALGGLWLCLWQGRWRFYGTAAIALGLASLLAAPRPDILVNDTGTLMAVRDKAGLLVLSSGRADRFAAEIWLRRNGQSDAATWPTLGATADGALSCDPLGCLYRKDGAVVALTRDIRAVAEDCREADLVVAGVPVPPSCPAAGTVDRFDVWRNGATEITIRPEGPVVRTVGDSVGDRPWSLRRDRPAD